MRRLFKFLGRWASALVGVTSGWLINFFVYINIANASALDRQSWLYWTGMFCLLAWFLVGLPLSLSDLDVSSTRGRLVSATAMSGLVGVLMIVVFFGFSLSTPFFVFGGLAFMTAAVSMLVYAALRNILPVRG
jgi:hypothetical protein